MKNKNHLYYIIGILFCFAIFLVILKGHEPWKRKEQEQERKNYFERIEQFKNNEIHEFLKNCNIEYKFSNYLNHDIDLNELADIIERAKPSYEPVNRSTSFGQIIFSGKINGEEFTVTLVFSNYSKNGYVYIMIDNYKRFSSSELQKWAVQNYPEIFNEMRK